ncbi:hypothetical protein ACP70R_020699 [Stipagrostis hirtigluma subsp. patula]
MASDDPTGPRLWRFLTKGLCWRLLVTLRRRNGVPEFPRFMSLPDDMKAAVLTRLSGGGQALAMVERTCTALRRLVADRDGELWKAVYQMEAEFCSRLVHAIDDVEVLVLVTVAVAVVGRSSGKGSRRLPCTRAAAAQELL